MTRVGQIRVGNCRRAPVWPQRRERPGNDHPRSDFPSPADGWSSPPVENPPAAPRMTGYTPGAGPSGATQPLIPRSTAATVCPSRKLLGHGQRALASASLGRLGKETLRIPFPRLPLPMSGIIPPEAAEPSATPRRKARGGGCSPEEEHAPSQIPPVPERPLPLLRTTDRSSAAGPPGMPTDPPGRLHGDGPARRPGRQHPHLQRGRTTADSPGHRPVHRGEVAVDPHPETQLGPEGVEASYDAVDAEALLVPVVGGREEGVGASVGWNSATTPAGADTRVSLRSRPAGAPPAGRRPRPSARRRTARCPGRPGTGAAPARSAAPGWGRG